MDSSEAATNDTQNRDRERDQDRDRDRDSKRSSSKAETEENESELVYISQFEFASIVEKLKLMSQFKHNGTAVVNKFETVITEVVGSKYDNVLLDFKNCFCPSH